MVRAELNEANLSEIVFKQILNEISTKNALKDWRLPVDISSSKWFVLVSSPDPSHLPPSREDSITLRNFGLANIAIGNVHSTYRQQGTLAICLYLQGVSLVLCSLFGYFAAVRKTPILLLSVATNLLTPGHFSRPRWADFSAHWECHYCQAQFSQILEAFQSGLDLLCTNCDYTVSKTEDMMTQHTDLDISDLADVNLSILGKCTFWHPSYS
ncbi:hypothetical protein ACTXT7_010065 [Hymenolepis weldensis]